VSSPNDIKKGTVVNQSGELWMVMDFQRVSPGKGSSFVRTKMKNLATGKTQEVAFKASESLTFEDVAYKKMQYLFSDASGYTFMDLLTYEQVTLHRDMVGEDAKFLREGLEVSVVTHNGNALTLALPKKISYAVIFAPPAVKGDTAGGNVTKEVEMDNGLRVAVPIFIKEGDHIVVNTDDNSYVERVAA
jgi:elongation factor P